MGVIREVTRRLSDALGLPEHVVEGIVKYRICARLKEALEQLEGSGDELAKIILMSYLREEIEECGVEL